MSNVIDDIFVDFLHANDIQGNPVFGKGMEYDFDGKTWNKAGLQGSVHFTGFLEGVQRKPRRGDGPQGSVAPGSTRMDALDQLRGSLQGTRLEGRIVTDIETDPDYHRQYDLGLTYPVR